MTPVVLVPEPFPTHFGDMEAGILLLTGIVFTTIPFKILPFYKPGLGTPKIYSKNCTKKEGFCYLTLWGRNCVKNLLVAIHKPPRVNLRANGRKHPKGCS